MPESTASLICRLLQEDPEGFASSENGWGRYVWHRELTQIRCSVGLLFCRSDTELSIGFWGGLRVRRAVRIWAAARLQHDAHKYLNEAANRLQTRRSQQA